MAPGGTVRTVQSQTVSQRQTLALSQRQSVEMLAMSLPELRERLYAEMASNPCIEDVGRPIETVESAREKNEASGGEERDAALDWPDDGEFEERAYTADADAAEKKRGFIESRAASESLEAHLLGQIAVAGLPQAERLAAEAVAGDLDQNGYFTGSAPDIAMAAGTDLETVERARRAVMSLDPPGCGARTAAECLLAQADSLAGREGAAEALEILKRGFLPDVARGDSGKVMKELGIGEDAYSAALSAITALEPHPGRAYRNDSMPETYIDPEVHAVKGKDGRYIAMVDGRSLPEIRISGEYLKMLSDPHVDAKTREYIREKKSAAEMLADAVERRQDTILAASQAIFDSQPLFFEKGLPGLRPLTMKEIAEKTGVHHSTVSRTVRGKYASTPFGTVELRRFFAGDEVSPLGRGGAEDRIARLVASEDKKHPLSDENISAICNPEGFATARRTVAKYRAALGIPGARERSSV